MVQEWAIRKFRVRVNYPVSEEWCWYSNSVLIHEDGRENSGVMRGSVKLNFEWGLTEKQLTGGDSITFSEKKKKNKNNDFIS